MNVHDFVQTRMQQVGDRPLDEIGGWDDEVIHNDVDVTISALSECPELMTLEEFASALRVNVKTATDFFNEIGPRNGARRVGRQYRIWRDSVIDYFSGRGRSEERR